MKKLYLLAGILLFLILYRAMTGPRGTAPDQFYSPTVEPLQEEIPESEQAPVRLKTGDYEWTITPKANYRIAARVLSTERYRLGWQSDLSPVDLALGWGDLADQKADEWIDWSQMGRWYIFRWEQDSPFDANKIIAQSANVHIVPSTQNLKAASVRVSRNDRVFLEGALVNMDGTRGNKKVFWHTSLSRTDTGEGSCEILYLKKLLWDGKEYH